MPPRQKPARITYNKKYLNLQAIKFDVSEDKTKVQFRFWFREGVRRESIECGASPDQAMGIMVALQKLQQTYRFPIPPALRPDGVAALHLVDPNDHQP